MKETIKNLTEAYGPSGFEDQIRDAIRAEIRGLADSIRVNALGSLIALKKGSGGKNTRRVLLMAHMDEIGLIVTHVDAKGYARVTNIGGIAPANCIGQRVRFASGAIGVVMAERREPAESGRPLSIEQLFVDTGARDKASTQIKVGDAAGFVQPFVDLGERLVAKTMDDRVGCAILIETMRRLASRRTPHEVHFVFSVQEEVTLAGARTTGYEIEPDVAIAVDVTLTGDVPKARPMAVELGKGPAIKVQDSGMIAHVGVKNLMIRRAEESKIPYQLEVLRSGTTDASAIQLVREGVPSGCLSVPCRYVHTQAEMVDVTDTQRSVDLLAAILTKPIDV